MVPFFERIATAIGSVVAPMAAPAASRAARVGMPVTALNKHCVVVANVPQLSEVASRFGTHQVMLFHGTGNPLLEGRVRAINSLRNERVNFGTKPEGHEVTKGSATPVEDLVYLTTDTSLAMYYSRICMSGKPAGGLNIVTMDIEDFLKYMTKDPRYKCGDSLRPEEAASVMNQCCARDGVPDELVRIHIPQSALEKHREAFAPVLKELVKSALVKPY